MMAAMANQQQQQQQQRDTSTSPPTLQDTIATLPINGSMDPSAASNVFTFPPTSTASAFGNPAAMQGMDMQQAQQLQVSVF